MSKKWYGKFIYSNEGVVDYVESESKEVAQAFVDGIQSVMNELESSGEDNPLEDYWTTVDQIEMTEES